MERWANFLEEVWPGLGLKEGEVLPRWEELLRGKGSLSR